MARPSVANTAEAAPSALDELLSAERDIATRSAEVTGECEALLEAAHRDARAVTLDAAAALERELAAAAEEARRECEAIVRELESDAASAIDRYRHLSDSDVEQLAELVAARITGLAIPVSTTRGA